MWPWSEVTTTQWIRQILDATDAEPTPYELRGTAYVDGGRKRSVDFEQTGVLSLDELEDIGGV